MGLCYSVHANSPPPKGRILMVDELDTNNRPMIVKPRIIPITKSQEPPLKEKGPDIARMFGL